MNFTKMHGIGNDFIIIEDLKGNFKKEEQDIAKKLCNRNFGIGADGLVIVRETKDADIEMVIINSDGSRANMCGNAIRCFGRYVYDNSIVKNEKFSIKTGDGIKEIELIKEDSKIKGAKVFMGVASYKGEDIPLRDDILEIIKRKEIINGKEYILTTALVGVPHTIVIDNEEKHHVNEGRFIEKSSLFKEGTNVNFVQVLDRENVNVRTWERGAGATLACGTGASAVAAITNRFNLTNSEVNVHLPGGTLKILVKEEGIYMIGPCEYICKGEVL